MYRKFWLMCFISQTTSVQPVGNSLVHFSLRKVTPTSIHNAENRLLHGLVDISAYYVQWLRITTCFIYTEWCWGVIYTLLDAISLVVNPFCPISHSMYCNCSFLIDYLCFLFVHNMIYSLVKSYLQAWLLRMRRLRCCCLSACLFVRCSVS